MVPSHCISAVEQSFALERGLRHARLQDQASRCFNNSKILF